MEVLVGESIFLYVWRGNGVRAPLFSNTFSCVPATIFGQKFRSARNQVLFIDQYSDVSNDLFSTCCAVFLKLR